MNRDRLRFILLFALSTLLCAIVSAKVTGKHASELSSLKRSAAKAAEELYSHTAETGKPPLSELDRDTIALALPDRPQIDALIERLVAIFSEHEVNTSGWNVHTSAPPRRQNDDQLTQVTLDIGFTCNPQILASVLHALRNTPRLVLIDRITAEPALGSDPSLLTVNLRIAAFSKHDLARNTALEYPR